MKRTPIVFLATAALALTISGSGFQAVKEIRVVHFDNDKSVREYRVYGLRMYECVIGGGDEPQKLSEKLLSISGVEFLDYGCFSGYFRVRISKWSIRDWPEIQGQIIEAVKSYVKFYDNNTLRWNIRGMDESDRITLLLPPEVYHVKMECTAHPQIRKFHVSVEGRLHGSPLIVAESAGLEEKIRALRGVMLAHVKDDISVTVDRERDWPNVQQLVIDVIKNHYKYKGKWVDDPPIDCNRSGR
jgi:hypothetical protein